MAKGKSASRHRTSIGALLREPNPWSAWMSDDEQPPLSGVRYTALLLRELSVRQLIDHLAPALLAADAAGQAIVERVLRENPLGEGETFGFETWLHIWDIEARDPYEQAVRDTANALGTTDDLRLFGTIMAKPETDPAAVLWFLLKGIRYWALEDEDIPGQISDEAVWLIELLLDDLADEDDDPLAPLFAHLYRRFQANTGHRTQPLPVAYVGENGHVLAFDGDDAATSFHAGILLSAARDKGGETTRLSDLLGQSARHWSQAASDIRSLRQKGLLEPAGFEVTPAGREAARELGSNYPLESVMPSDPAVSKKRHN